MEQARQEQKTQSHMRGSGREHRSREADLGSVRQMGLRQRHAFQGPPGPSLPKGGRKRYHTQHVFSLPDLSTFLSLMRLQNLTNTSLLENQPWLSEAISMRWLVGPPLARVPCPGPEPEMAMCPASRELCPAPCLRCSPSDPQGGTFSPQSAEPQGPFSSSASSL